MCDEMYVTTAPCFAPHVAHTALCHGGQWKGVRHLLMQSARAEGNNRSVTPAGFRKVRERQQLCMEATLPDYPMPWE